MRRRAEPRTVATVIAPPKPAAPVEEPKTEPPPPAPVRARGSWRNKDQRPRVHCYLLFSILTVSALMCTSALLYAVADI